MFITGLKKRESDIWVSRDLGDTFELDEMYWFIGFKTRSSTRENVYIILIICPEPREIVGFSVSRDKSQDRIQSIVDSAPPAEYYNTDGYLGYINVVYPGKHVRNVRDKSDTHNVESINADLRHYIPVLARRSRCFSRKLETLEAVVAVFVNAYNKFGAAKLRNRVPTVHKSTEHAKHLHKYREVGFSLVDFL